MGLRDLCPGNRHNWVGLCHLTYQKGGREQLTWHVCSLVQFYYWGVIIDADPEGWEKGLSVGDGAWPTVSSRHRRAISVTISITVMKRWETTKRKGCAAQPAVTGPGSIQKEDVPFCAQGGDLVLSRR